MPRISEKAVFILVCVYVSIYYKCAMGCVIVKIKTEFLLMKLMRMIQLKNVHLLHKVIKLLKNVATDSVMLELSMDYVVVFQGYSMLL